LIQEPFVKAIATFNVAVNVNGRENVQKVAFGYAGKAIVVTSEVIATVSIELTEVE